MPETIRIDLSAAQISSERTRDLLLAARRELNLKPYEYTESVRIAPGEIPHSHPVLTLNNRIEKKNELICTYLHEQMHWYVTWFSHAYPEAWRALIDDIEARYPNIPVAFPEGAHTLFSSLLHVLVNWLEIEAASAVLGRNEAVHVASRNFVYSGIYKLVLKDWDELSALFHRAGVAPIRPATDMTPDDLALAARMDEAPVT